MMKHANIFWRQWLNSRRLWTWPRMLVLLASWPLMPGAYCADSPPAPPGFPGTSTGDTPKAAEFKASLGQSLTQTIQAQEPVVGAHAPPIAVIEWRFMPEGFVERDPALINQVPMKVWREPAAPNTSLRIEFLGESNRVYEVQCKLGPHVWMGLGKFTVPNNNAVTTWCPMFPEERVGLVRVMSN